MGKGAAPRSPPEMRSEPREPGGGVRTPRAGEISRRQGQGPLPSLSQRSYLRGARPGRGGDRGPPSVGLPPAEPAPPPLLRCQWYGPVANPWLPWQPPGVQPAPPPPAAGVARGRPLQRLPGRLGPAPATRGRRCIRPRSRYGRPSLGAGLRQPLSRGRGTPLQTPKLRGLAPLYLLSLGST